MFQSKEARRQHLAQQQEMLRIQAEQKLIAKQQQILKDQPFVQDAEVNLKPNHGQKSKGIPIIFFTLGFHPKTNRSILQSNT